MLKYGFCKKSFRKNATLTSWTLFSSQKGTCSTIQVQYIPFCVEKSVQLIRFFAPENIKKQASKVATNRPNFFSIANRPKTSPILNFCSIKQCSAALSTFTKAFWKGYFQEAFTFMLIFKLTYLKSTKYFVKHANSAFWIWTDFW